MKTKNSKHKKSTVHVQASARQSGVTALSNTAKTSRLTHDQRRARRKQIARAVLSGGNRAVDVAADFGMNIAQVYAAVHEFRDAIKHKSREQRLREKMLPLVEKIRKGSKLAALASEFAVDVQKLSALCREKGVSLRRGRPKEKVWSPKRYEGVDWAQTDREIATQLGCTHQAVNAIRQKLLKLGLIQPRRNAVNVALKKQVASTKAKGTSPVHSKRLQHA